MPKGEYVDYWNGIDTSLLNNQYLKEFVKWYLDGAKKEDFKKFGTLSDKYEYAIQNYLTRADVQSCIADYYKRKKDMDFIKLYQTMLKKAVEGDTKSADWILKAQESAFFKTKSKSAIDELVEGFDLKE